jgi:beta-N-acetylhexosaminidase
MTLAWISGCAALELSDDERAVFEATPPWGLILFKRNVETPAQVAALTRSFREAVGRPDAPVLIDQEGGRVQRLRPPHWPSYPSAAAYARCGSVDDAAEAARLGGRLIADDLLRLGITVDCAPVLDRPVPDSHDVIGNRAFGHDGATIVRLAGAFAAGLMDGGVMPVVKHVPGHGRAGVDSHLSLPVVEADLTTLADDFEPFRRLVDLPMAMTAHVVYTAIDPERPATTSRIVLERIVRGTIGFDGLLISDDLSMEALKGTLGQRAAGAREAGCDMLLHCNGKMDEARAVAAEARPIAGDTARRVAAAMARFAPAKPLERGAAEVRFADLLGLPTVA